MPITLLIASVPKPHPAVAGLLVGYRRSYGVLLFVCWSLHRPSNTASNLVRHAAHSKFALWCRCLLHKTPSCNACSSGAADTKCRPHSSEHEITDRPAWPFAIFLLKETVAGK